MKRLWLVLLVGCADNSLPPESPSPALVSASCSAVGAQCDKGEDCCSGHCQINGVYEPTWRTCQPPLEDGVYCNADGDCASKKCIEYRCGGVGLCVGESCVSDGDCCAGTYCYNETYAPFMCELKGRTGDWCTSGNHCRSGRCKEYVCVP